MTLLAKSLLPWQLAVLALLTAGSASAQERTSGGQAVNAAPPASTPRVYKNILTQLEKPRPILADYPEFFEPIVEQARFEAPPLVVDEGADLNVRAWRFSYNARGIVEMPNSLKASRTAVIVVHPWGIDDGQGWDTPEPAGVADFGTKTKNHLAGRHTREVVRPFVDALRGQAALVMASLRGAEKPVHKKLYRSIRHTPSEQERAEGKRELREILGGFNYRGESLPEELRLSEENPVRDYFQQFPGIDGYKYNNEGFWDLPLPVCQDLGLQANDIVYYDEDGYPALRDYLKEQGVRHVLLAGYATDMCFCKTTAGYENLSKDFNVFLVADASLATFPSNQSPRFAVNASISYAALNQLITQVSWVEVVRPAAGK